MQKMLIPALYTDCSESNASMLVSLHPDKVSKWNKKQSIAWNMHFVYILHFSMLVQYNAASANKCVTNLSL